MDDAGGYLWMVMTVFGVLVLGGALAYGVTMWRNRRRDASTERVRDRTTERLYQKSETNSPPPG